MPTRLEVHLTPIERRRIAHALRQTAAAARACAAVETPPGMDAAVMRRYREHCLEEAHIDERLAADVERSEVVLERPAT